jgi:hypothetical protein
MSIPIANACFIEGWMSSIDAAKQERAGFQPHPGETASSMAGDEFLEEAEKLHSVSASLDALAAKNARTSEALSTLARTVRNSAMLLELLSSLRLGSDGDVENASN